MNANVRAQLLAHGAKLPQKAQGSAQAPRTPPAQGKTPPAASAPVVAPESGIAGKQAQYYVGPYALQVANGTHYPGRVRCVVVGPACEELTAALVAALESFTSKQPK